MDALIKTSISLGNISSWANSEGCTSRRRRCVLHPWHKEAHVFPEDGHLRSSYYSMYTLYIYVYIYMYIYVLYMCIYIYYYYYIVLN